MTFVTGLSERIRYDLSSLAGPPFFGALLLALAYRFRSTFGNELVSLRAQQSRGLNGR